MTNGHIGISGRLPIPPTSCDVVVIGAGVAGLSCANYLVQAGMSVVLVEKHYVVGGCCSSFRRGPYYFDAGAHYLSSCRQNGQVGKLIRDMDLKIELIRCNPSDLIIAGEKRVQLVNSSLQAMSREFECLFPGQADHIRRFWSYIGETDSRLLYADLQSLTFRQLLDRFFKDQELRNLLSVPLGNIGLPSNRASALTAAFLYREYLLDGGYYPRGGMQKFPDALLESFRRMGGTALLLTPAERINLDYRGSVRSVSIKVAGTQRGEIKTKYVVANCDPIQLWTCLLGSEETAALRLASSSSRFVPSISCFMVHLGVKMDLRKVTQEYCNIWYYPGSCIDSYYEGLLRGEVEFGKDGFLICSLPSLHDSRLLPEGRHSIHLIVGAPVKDRAFWEANKERLANDLVNRLERFFPSVSKSIEVRQVATPFTLMKYTRNYQGAMYGWASTPESVGRNRVVEEMGAERIYLTGHWTGLPTGYSGIPTAVASGRLVAGKILRQERSTGIAVGQEERMP